MSQRWHTDPAGQKTKYCTSLFFRKNAAAHSLVLSERSRPHSITSPSPQTLNLDASTPEHFVCVIICGLGGVISWACGSDPRIGKHKPDLFVIKQKALIVPRDFGEFAPEQSPALFGTIAPGLFPKRTAFIHSPFPPAAAEDNILSYFYLPFEHPTSFTICSAV